MKETTQLAVVEKLILDLLDKHISNMEAVRGPRGFNGQDGKDFDFEENKNLIREQISSLIPDRLDLKGDKGRDGRDGKDFDLEEVREEITEILSKLIPEKSELKGDQGERGSDGRDGKDFDLEEVREEITEILSKLIPEKSELKGEKGEDGRDGQDGKDGKDFVFEENKEKIEETISAIVQSTDSLKGEKGDPGDPGRDGRDGRDFKLSDHESGIRRILDEAVSEIRDYLKLKFSDLTEEEKLSIKGEKGSDGRDGKDGKDGSNFSFEENKEEIQSIIKENIPPRVEFKDFTEEEKLELTPKFENFTDSQKEEIRGMQGPRGKDGSNFSFEENKEEIQAIIKENIPPRVEFKDFTEEEKKSLSLKFDDLRDDQKEELKGRPGARGQRGRAGDKGDKGDTGLRGLPGLKGDKGETGERGEKGADGKRGPMGIAGRDGESAPIVDEVKLNYTSKQFSFTFIFSDGSEVETNRVKFPSGKSSVVSLPGYGGFNGGGGGGSSSPTEYFLNGMSVGISDKVNFVGSNFNVTEVDGKIQVEVESENSEITVKKDDVEVGDTKVLNFVGDNIEVEEDGEEIKISVIQVPVTVSKDGSSVVSTLEIDFVGDNIQVQEVGGKAVVSVDNSSTEGSLEIYDEYDQVASQVKGINFIGPNVKVRPRVNMSEWNVLSDVEPSLSDYPGPDGDPDQVDVYIEVNDPSILPDVEMDPSCYVGALVRISADEVAFPALADSWNNSNVMGIVESIVAGRGNIKISGKTSDLFIGLDPTKDYFLSATVPGALSTVVPTLPGQVELRVGQAFGTTKFVFIKGERTEKR